MKFLLFLFLPVLGFSQAAQYTNLALEGGGIRGVAYAGAFKVLEQKGIMQHIDKVAGSSAGAITGMMLCIGFNADEIDSMLMSLSFQKFNDGRGGLIGKYRRVKRKFGVYKGNRYEKWLREMLLAKTGNPDLTFRQLHDLKSKGNGYRDLYCTGTNISRQRLETFCYERSPDFSVATAVRISGGIPLYFAPVTLDDSLHLIEAGDTSAYKNYYVDGGMLVNYPISMFDSCHTGGDPLTCDQLAFNSHTIGIKLERDEQINTFLKDSITIPPFSPKNFNGYLDAFSNLTVETMSRKYPGLKNELGRSIYINYGDISPQIKNMSKKTKQMLYQNGMKGAERFFASK